MTVIRVLTDSALGTPGEEVTVKSAGPQNPNTASEPLISAHAYISTMATSEMQMISAINKWG
jgi:hypothetical protein